MESALVHLSDVSILYLILHHVANVAAKARFISCLELEDQVLTQISGVLDVFALGS
jgi:hypothetical protein